MHARSFFLFYYFIFFYVNDLTAHRQETESDRSLLEFAVVLLCPCRESAGDPEHDVNITQQH